MHFVLRALSGRVAAAVAVVLGVLVLVPGVATAAFPGTNGDIAFVTTRGDNVAIEQVDPGGSGVGTSTGDLSNTTPLTAGSVDAEPFYSPDGTEVVFSSNRTGRWAIYEIAQTDTDEATPATEISQVSGEETHDDYGPSFSPNGQIVVFNRDNQTIDTTYLPDGPSSTCLLYAPPDGLAAASADNGASSRVVYDPVDPGVLAYVAGDNHIHVLSGFQPPTSAHPCPPQPQLTDVDLSATATGTAIGPTQADANPDWSPDGTKIIFDSTRAGGHSLWYFSDPTSPDPTVTALWPGLADSTTTTDTQPVFSPDGTHITYTQPVSHAGTQVIDVENTFGAPESSEVDLTLGAGASANSQPDWQPLAPSPDLPEAPSVLFLPGGALVAGGAYVLLSNLRRRHRLPAAP